MFRCLRIIAAVGFAIFSYGQGHAQSVRFDEAAFLAYLSGVEARLQSVYRQELVSAVELASGERFDVALVFDDQCNLQPIFEPRSTPPEIRLDRRAFVALSSYVSQVTLFYILGVEEFRSPASVELYVRETIQPFVASLRDRCGGTVQSPATLQEIVGLSFVYSPIFAGRPYDRIRHDAEARPQAAYTAEIVAGLPLFFVVLHELGHASLHTGEVEDFRLAEFEADAWAADVFSASGTPMTLGLPILQAFANDRQSEDIRCRIATLAEADSLANRLLPEIDQIYRDRIAALRDYYRREYRRYCQAPD